VILTDKQFSFDVVHTVAKDYLLPLLCCVVGHKLYSRFKNYWAHFFHGVLKH
jgi:hypothetical protein